MSESALVGQRSRSRIAPFRLHRPTTVDEAIGCMEAAQPGAVYMAGGVDLMNRMKSGFAPSEVIHLGRVGEMAQIAERVRTIELGACATHGDISEHEVVRSRAPALARCWRDLAHPRVRCKGTVGGNVMARESAYDATLLLMAADAVLNFAAPGGRRTRVGIANAGTDHGLLTSIELSAPEGLQFRCDRSLRPVLNLVVGMRMAGAYIGDVRVAIGGVYGRAYVSSLGLAAPLSRADLARRAGTLAADLVATLPPALDDWRASGAYRIRMVRVLTQRLLEREGAAPC